MQQQRLQLTRQPDGTISEATIFAKKAPLIARAILVLFAVIGLLLPVLIIALVVSDGKGLKFLTVIGIGISLGVTVFFTRLLLWNTYGKEVFALSRTTVRYWCDYKYFQDRKLQLEGGDFECFFLPEGETEAVQLPLDTDIHTGGRLVIRNTSGEIISHIVVPTAELTIALKALEEQYNDPGKEASLMS